MQAPTIAIVGGGFSGTMVSLCLQSFSPVGTRICLIERRGRFASGTAYGSSNPNHLLNVPAGRMGAFPDMPLDFLRWLQAQPASRLGGIEPTESALCRAACTVATSGTCSIAGWAIPIPRASNWCTARSLAWKTAPMM